MIGPIIGDIAGSRFEHHNHKSKEFDMWHPDTRFTDDTVMSLAICDAILRSDPSYYDLGKRAVESMQAFGRRHKHRGYGGRFTMWLTSPDPRPYGSYGNGGPMRVAACGWAGTSLEEVKQLAKAVTEVTHNHPDALHAAEAVATTVFLARNGATREQLRQWITENYYPLDFTIDEIRPTYSFDVSSKGSVPQALEAFLESEDFEDAIRTAVSVGGDSDTIASITGGIAEAFYGVPDHLREKAESYLPDALKVRLMDFERHYPVSGKSSGSDAADTEITGSEIPRGLYFTQLASEFPVCNFTEKIDGNNLGYAMGITVEGIPFVAELFSDGQQYYLGFILPAFEVTPADGSTVAYGAAHADEEDSSLPDNVTCLFPSGVVHDYSALDVGMTDDGYEKRQDMTEMLVEWLAAHDLLRFTTPLHNGMVAYRIDSNGLRVMKIIITLEENGQALAQTPLRFAPFPANLQQFSGGKVVPFPGGHSGGPWVGQTAPDYPQPQVSDVVSMLLENLRSRFRGCLLGGAVGDALGYAVEFWDEDRIFRKYGPGGIEEYCLTDGKARFSDDTQMTLFTANALLVGEEDGAERRPTQYPWHDRLAEAYSDWLRTQTDGSGGKSSWLNNIPELNVRRAPGGTCMTYLAPDKIGSMRDRRNDSKGCGGIMRVAPVGLYFHAATDAEAMAVDLIGGEAAAITHGHELGFIPAVLLVHMLQDIVFQDASVGEALHDAMKAAHVMFGSVSEDTPVPPLYPSKHLNDLLTLLKKAEALAYDPSVPDLEAIHRLGEGWVAEETLAIAVFCALRYEDSFEKGIIAAVNHNGDSDSTGSVTGNILGARLGANAIPDRFLRDLELTDVITEIADDLLDGKQDSAAWKAKYATHDYTGKQ